ncbi:uncharacterized protein LOC113461148 [Phoenix dactylifera]|uniref:Uncharacterized protein LOC113461148 n=1 Tax=Phoenix dactylifera TaxID=42345 RepID=A0A8B8ZAT2_PHODC|nr:uncharacterized protein LOC113461148 [Phoenix dactylifera]
MVAALGPGRFYGSSLLQPRFYIDVKLNEDRVDPSVHVMDPLLSWTNEAHWSMGVLNLKRHHLQGRPKDSIKNPRAQQDRMHKNSPSLDRNPATKARLSGLKRKRVGRLGDEFDRIMEQQQMGKHSEAGEGVASRTQPEAGHGGSGTR